MNLISIIFNKDLDPLSLHQAVVYYVAVGINLINDQWLLSEG